MARFFSKDTTRLLFLLGLWLLVFSRASGQSFQNTGERNAAQRLVNLLREKGIPYEERSLLADYGGFGSSLYVRINAPGTGSPARTGDENDLDDPGEPWTFALAVPLGSSFAVETALAFIDAARERQPARNLLIAFLGDEKSRLDTPELSGPGYSHKGLRDLVSVPNMPETWVVCYLDADAPPEELLIHHGAGNYIAPLELADSLASLLESSPVPASFAVRYNELYKLGLTQGSDELALLWEGEINGVYLGPGEGGGQKKIEARDLGRLLLDYAEKIQFPLQSQDRHYSIISLGKKTIFFPEKTLVLFLLSGIAVFVFILLVYSVSRRVILLARIRLFFRYSWIFLIFLPLMTLIIRWTGIFYASLLNVFNVPVPGADFWGSILIILLALWVFYLLSLGLDFFRIPRKSAFYGASAVIIAGLGFLVAAVLDLTYTVVFFWAFIFTFLAATLRKPGLVFLSIVLIPLRALLVIHNVWEINGLPVYLLILRGNFRAWIAIFQAAILCLPPILLVNRSLIFVNLKKSRGKKPVFKALAFRLGVLVILAGLMTVQVLSLPKDKAGEALEDISGSHGFTITLTETAFLESRVVNVRLHSRTAPLGFELFLKSDDNEAPLVYSSPVPMERREDNSLRFILGENPPNPLELEIVLRRDFRGSFWGTAVYDDGGTRFQRVQGTPVPLTTGIPD